MTNTIQKVQLSDTIDFQRQRINEALDVVNNIDEGILEVNTEANLPSPSTATTNICLVKNHSVYKGAVLALKNGSSWVMTPLKGNPINANSYAFFTLDDFEPGVAINKMVYLDSGGIWRLADSTDPNKKAMGMVGPSNSIILGGLVQSSGLTLTPGTKYYYNNVGSLTTTLTAGYVGKALNTNTINLDILDIDVNKREDYMSNCILKIPQDIIWEFDDSAHKFTIKAGSKFYVPNGLNGSTPLYTSKTSTVDMNVSWSTASDSQQIVYIIINGNNLNIGTWGLTKSVSGTTDSLAGTTFHSWYDTTTNYIKGYENTTSTTPTYPQMTFPVALLTLDANGVKSVDQVFNGFGFIGSTAFALTGVKYLCPDGRNADGTSKTNVITLSNPLVRTWTWAINGGTFIFDGGQIELASSGTFFIQDAEPTIGSNYERWYSPRLNKMFYHTAGGTAWLERNTMCIIGSGTKTVSNITDLTVKTVFRAVDYNELVQVDWNVSDTKSLSFIKNKPGVVSKTAIGFCPQLPNETTTTKFLRQDGSWSVPPYPTPAVVSKTANGLCPQLPNESTVTKFLRQDGSWTVPPYPTYSTVSKTAAGLCPQLPNETTVTKFLRQDGSWSVPAYPDISGKLDKSGAAMTGTLSDANAAQVRNIQILTSEGSSGNNGWIYAVRES